MKVCTVKAPLLDTGRITTPGLGDGNGYRNRGRDAGRLARHRAGRGPASLICRRKSSGFRLLPTAFGMYPKTLPLR